jgi:hypothetical protein
MCWLFLGPKNKTYTFDVSSDACTMIKFTSVVDSQGNVSKDIYPFQNIGDLVVGDFYQGVTAAIDLYTKDKFECDPGLCNCKLLELRSETSMRVLLQDIGHQGRDDDDDLSSFVGFVGQCVAKYVTNEQQERSIVYGAVEEVFHSVLNLHGNDSVQKA